MSNEEAYVSSLERLLLESRSAAERRCTEYDGKIYKYDTYHIDSKSANHPGANASAAASAAEEMKGEIVLYIFQFDRRLCAVPFRFPSRQIPPLFAILPFTHRASSWSKWPDDHSCIS